MLQLTVFKDWTYFYNGVIPKTSKYIDPEEYLNDIKPCQILMPNGSTRFGRPVKSLEQILPPPAEDKPQSDDHFNDGSLPTNSTHFIVTKPRLSSSERILFQMVNFRG